MKTKSFLRVSICAIITLLAACFATQSHINFFTPAVEAAPLRPLMPDEQNELHSFYKAGLTGNTSQVSFLIAAVQDKNTHPYLLKAALYALTRLKATQALPSIETLIQTDANSDIGSYATVVKARLLAEGGPESTFPTASSLHRFYSQLELSPQSLSEGVTTMSLQSRDVGLPTVEVYAMREAADIVYRSPPASLTASLAASPEISAVNYSADYPSALKMRLAGLSSENRVKTLVQELSHARVISENERLKQQLLAEYGTLASQAAANKLKDMVLHQDQYTPEGFGLLLGILGVTADRKQLPLIIQFRRDSNPEIANYAQAAYLSNVGGVPEPIVADY